MPGLAGQFCQVKDSLFLTYIDGNQDEDITRVDISTIVWSAFVLNGMLISLYNKPYITSRP